jgi:hypothetical protein
LVNAYTLKSKVTITMTAIPLETRQPAGMSL